MCKVPQKLMGLMCKVPTPVRGRNFTEGQVSLYIPWKIYSSSLH
jgi:hypothetical protein